MRFDPAAPPIRPPSPCPAPVSTSPLRSYDPRARVADLIRSKGDTNMTVEQLTQEIIPQGRATVPDEIKAELLQRIRRFAEQQA